MQLCHMMTIPKLQLFDLQAPTLSGVHGVNLFGMKECLLMHRHTTLRITLIHTEATKMVGFGLQLNPMLKIGGFRK